MWNRLQIGAVVFSVFLVLVLYFGFDIVSDQGQIAIENIERSGINLDPRPMIEAAKESLSSNDLNELVNLENQAVGARDIDHQYAIENIASKWLQLEKPFFAGYYYEKIAEEINSAVTWRKAASVYRKGLGDLDPAVADACLDKCVRALENAISLAPDTVRYRVDLALLYTDRPPRDNPMKGVQMLIGLNEKHPNHVLVLNSLGHLAMKTGQWERAKDRLENAKQVDPENADAICMLAQVYQHLDDKRALEERKKCESLTVKK